MSYRMEVINDLLKALLLGTEKVDVKPLLDRLPSTIQAKIAQLSSEDTETQFLQLSSLLLPYEQAGKEFPKIDTVLAISQEESLMYTANAATQLLATLLRENQTALVLEWLEVCAEKSHIISPEFLPQLLTLSQDNIPLQYSIRKVMGERGKWLAEMNEDWHLLLKSTEELWETGRASQRRQLFQYLMQQDQPLAKKLLLESWGEESATDRLEFLSIWADYPDAQDISFLDTIRQQDKSKKVSALAKELLLRQPESMLAQRLSQAGATLLTLKESGVFGLGAAKIEVHPDPTHLQIIEELDLEKESLHKTFSDQEYQAFQLLAIILPQQWEATLKLAPEKIIKQFLTNKVLHKYRPALVKAIVFHGNQEWANSWLKYCSASDITQQQWQEDALALLPLASQDTLLQLFDGKVLKGLLTYNHLLDSLETFNFPWSLKFSKAVMHLLYQVYAERGVYYNEVDRMLRLAHRLHSEILAHQQEFTPPANEKRETWRAMTGDLFRIITLRTKIKTSFDE
uniref:DUF5691 domain-containing protein n=1 Tax=Roseihalotalea indica TaxID=2867963 RepID=A0AA49JG81_9BACT|nr:DUF5691 domain-containing protein [Tunicatimonas sp. TK19036]